MNKSGSKIVQTDLQGTILNVVAAPGGPHHAIAADDWGNLAVYQSDDHGQALLLFNSRGLQVATVTPPGPVHSFAVRRQEVAWIGWDGSVMRAAPGSDAGVLFRMDPASAFAVRASGDSGPGRTFASRHRGSQRHAGDSKRRRRGCRLRLRGMARQSRPRCRAPAGDGMARAGTRGRTVRVIRQGWQIPRGTGMELCRPTCTGGAPIS